MVGSVTNDGATNIGAADSMDGTIIRLQRQEQKEKEAKAQQSKAAEAQIMASEGGYMKPAPEFKPSSETASGLMGLMSLVAVSGAMLGMKGRTSGLMAINAASGMMEGYNKGRNELFEQQKQQFEQHMKSWEQNRTMLKEAFDRALKIAPSNLTLAQETLNRDLVALGAQPLAAINKRSGPIAAAVAHSQFDSNLENQYKPLIDNARKLGINISSTADLLSEAQAKQAEAKAKIAAQEAALKRTKEEAEIAKLNREATGGLTPEQQLKENQNKKLAEAYAKQPDQITSSEIQQLVENYTGKLFPISTAAAETKEKIVEDKEKRINFSKNAPIAQKYIGLQTNENAKKTTDILSKYELNVKEKDTLDSNLYMRDRTDQIAQFLAKHPKAVGLYASIAREAAPIASLTSWFNPTKEEDIFSKTGPAVAKAAAEHPNDPVYSDAVVVHKMLQETSLIDAASIVPGRANVFLERITGQWYNQNYDERELLRILEERSKKSDDVLSTFNLDNKTFKDPEKQYPLLALGWKGLQDQHNNYVEKVIKAIKERPDIDKNKLRKALQTDGYDPSEFGL